MPTLVLSPRAVVHFSAELSASRRYDPSCCLNGVTEGFDEAVDIAHGMALVEFAEAVVLRDVPRVAATRAALRQALGDAGLIDAAAVTAAFHGFVRIADAIGIPYTTAAQGRDVPELREEAGVNAFYRVRGAQTRRFLCTCLPGPISRHLRASDHRREPCAF